MTAMEEVAQRFSEHVALAACAAGVLMLAVLTLAGLYRVTLPAVRRLWDRSNRLGCFFGTLLFLVGSIYANTKAPVRQCEHARRSATSLPVSTPAHGQSVVQTNHVFQILGISVDAPTRTVCLEIGWTPELFAVSRSRNVHLFAATNLPASRWAPAGIYSLPESADRCTIRLKSDAAGLDLPAGSPEALEKCAFYRFGFDVDSDNDGATDALEKFWFLTDARDPDTDGDGMPDGWETAHGLNPTSRDAASDADGDGLCNHEEFTSGTNPLSADTDGDGLSDWEELSSVMYNPFLPPLDASGGTNLLTAGENCDYRNFNLALPFEFACAGRVYTNLTVCMDGAVGLVSTEKNARPFSVSVRNQDMSEEDASGKHVAVAAYWDDLYANKNAGAQLRFADVAAGGGRYAVVEYSNVGLYDRRNDISATGTFQVVIPAAKRNAVYVRYVNLSTAFDGSSATVGAQDSKNRICLPVAYNRPGAVTNGMTIAYHFGTTSDPRLFDTDQDGLSDGLEEVLHIDPRQPDTDGDGMNDGWEYRHRDAGFAPLVHNAADGDPDNDKDADADGDNLSNGEECVWGIDPSRMDSDGDGTNDAAEIAQNSDPADAKDEGAANARIPVKFAFGDPSRSGSEKYQLEITPVSGLGDRPTAFTWLNERFGACETKTAMLKPGWRYEVRLKHAGTDPDYSQTPRPDYDYDLCCEQEGLPACVVLEDPQGLFEGSEKSETFAAAGKVATLTVYAVQEVCICSPDDESWGELDESRVVLDDEELRVKITVSPQIKSVEDCRRLFGDSVTVATSGTCPEGVQIPLEGAVLEDTPGKSEVRLRLTRRQMKDAGLLPAADNDGVDEMAWIDMADLTEGSGQDLSDSEAFARLALSDRGRAYNIRKTESPSPDQFVSKPVESYFMSAGREMATVSYSSAVAAKKQVMNQADCFYFSGHGNHATGRLQGGFDATMAHGRWNKDLNVVIIAGCSILDINDYNDNYTGIAHTASPGKMWEGSGPSVLLGYAYIAPGDAGGAPARIMQAWISYRQTMDDAEAWMRANAENKAWNACAIVKGEKYLYFEKIIRGLWKQRTVMKEAW